MKTKFCCHYHGWAVWAGLALACSVVSAEDYVVNTFDSESEVGQWVHWWGSPTWSLEFDPAVDAGGNPNSGSMKVTVDFDASAFPNDNQFSFRRDITPVVDGTKDSDLVMDIRFDPSSAKRASDFGYLEYGTRLPDWSQDYFGHEAMPITNGWVHLKTAVPITDKGIDTIAGITFKMWMGSGVSGTSTFWVDNIKLIGSTNAPPPAPTLGLRPALPGLLMMASKANAQYQRQSIRSVNSTYSWIGAANPVTYSISIANYPDPAKNGFQTHLFLVPGDSLPDWETSPDWNEANVIFLQIVNHQDGSGAGRFMYKVNEPNGNTMLWSTNGTLAIINSPSVLGTWSLTFSRDTKITLTTPSGTSTNFALPSGAAALFANPLTAYVGVQPNNPNNIGQSAILSRVQISGVENPVDEKFTGAALDPATWRIVAEDSSGVAPVPPDSKYWVSWTLPAGGFVLQSSVTLKPGSWTDTGLTNVVTVSGYNKVLVPATNLPSPSHGFFRLNKP